MEFKPLIGADKKRNLQAKFGELFFTFGFLMTSLIFAGLIIVFVYSLKRF